MVAGAKLTQLEKYAKIIYGAHWNLVHNFIGKKEIKMDLGRRFKNFDLIQQQRKFYQNKIDNLNLPTLEMDYNNACQCLKSEYKVFYDENANLFAKNMLNNNLYYLNKECFADHISEKEKEMNYKKIKKFSLAKLTENKFKKECENNERCLKGELNENDFFCLQNKNYKPKGNHPPKEMMEFLYQLSDGSTKNTEVFAKFTYNLLLRPKNSLSTVILAPKELHDSLNDYFNLLFNFVCWRTDFTQLGMVENQIFLPLYNFTRKPPVIIIEEGEIYVTEPYVSTLKKILNGTSLKFNSPYFKDEIVIRNTTPIIYITANKDKYLAMKNLYHVKGMVLNSKEITRLPHDQKLINWIRGEFAYLGYEWSRKAQTSNFKIPEINHTAAIKTFLEKYCIFDKDVSCTKKLLHEAYTQYFLKYCGAEPLSQIKFCRMVSELKCDQIETIRPHNSRQSYLYSFKGISLNGKACEEFINDPNEPVYKNDYEKFKEQLGKTIDEIFTTQTIFDV